MKRKIIRIDEQKCTGCGECIPNCPEGALQIIDSKARVISDLFCDGLGACIGHCPEDAITIEEREAEPYDEAKVMENIVKQGENVINAHLLHLKEHNQTDFLCTAINYLKQRDIKVAFLDELTKSEKEESKPVPSCPGARSFAIGATKDSAASQSGDPLQSELGNWPIQLQLLSPQAPYLKNSHLAIVADCVPFAYADFHRDFLKGKILTIFCPKLDKDLDQYVQKLAEIFKTQDLQSITILHMEVPCCFGIEAIVKQAQETAGTTIPIKKHIISIKGGKAS